MVAITLEAAQVRRRLDPAALPFAPVAAGVFHAWAVQTVDEGILLTGCPARARGAGAVFPTGSVHPPRRGPLACLTPTGCATSRPRRTDGRTAAASPPRA
jgi:hypothetical protein